MVPLVFEDHMEGGGQLGAHKSATVEETVRMVEFLKTIGFSVLFAHSTLTHFASLTKNQTKTKLDPTTLHSSQLPVQIYLSSTCLLLCLRGEEPETKKDSKQKTEGEVKKKPELMGSNFHHQQPQDYQHQQSSGLMRYRSAPSSLLESLVDGSIGGGCEDFQYLRSSSPEVDAILEKFMSSCNGSGDSNSHHFHELGSKSMKQEAMESVPKQIEYSNCSEMVYQAQECLANSGTNMKIWLENSMQAEMGARNCSNLIRQSSSPAGFFSNLNVENGFDEMRGVGNYKAGNGVKGETTASTSRRSRNNYMNFSNEPSSSSRLMPMGSDNGNKRSYASSFGDDSWQNYGFSSLKRAREDNGNMYLGLNSSLESQNGNSGNHTTTLAHQYSLPNTSAEMAAIDKFLQFQGSVPCKIRAKRGFATHPRSIAERMRRTRISDRMKKLQDLFPNMDKQTNTSDMLELAVEYIKDLQKHVKTLTDTRAKCTCSSKKKQYSSSCA